jgi:CRISPR system Cascade subunit CasD
LLAGCLGIERQDRARFQALDQSIEFAVRADHETLDGSARLTPTKMMDFHTVMDARRVDGRASRYPVVSRREYLCDAKFTVAIRASTQPRIDLDELEAAVKKPYYTPFLGRRSCPLSRPLWERRVTAESSEQALAQVDPKKGVIYSEWIDCEHSRLQLRDVPVRTGKRQFMTRYVNIKNVNVTGQQEETPDVSE